MTKTIKKPWGHYEVVDLQEGFQIKKIVVKPEAKLSLQSHQHRSEHWIVAYGIATVEIGEEIFNLKSGESKFIPKKCKHRLENNGNKDLMIIEIQLGEYLGEDDIIRYEDIYNRKVINDS